MRRSGNFRVSRFVKVEEPTVQFTVYFLRLNPRGARFVAGLVGFPPHSQAVSQARNYTLSESAENRADSLNATDQAA